MAAAVVRLFQGRSTGRVFVSSELQIEFNIRMVVFLKGSRGIWIPGSKGLFAWDHGWIQHSYSRLSFLPPPQALSAQCYCEQGCSSEYLIDLLPSAMGVESLHLLLPSYMHFLGYILCDKKRDLTPHPKWFRKCYEVCQAMEPFVLRAALIHEIILMLKHGSAQHSGVGVAPVYRGICFLSFSLEETCYAVSNKTKNKDQSQWKCCNVSRQKH